MYDQLESCLRHRNEMVVFEAARAILNLPDVTTKELMPALASMARASAWCVFPHARPNPL